jgi:hypothetical protein
VVADTSTSDYHHHPHYLDAACDSALLFEQLVCLLSQLACCVSFGEPASTIEITAALVLQLTLMSGLNSSNVNANHAHKCSIGHRSAGQQVSAELPAYLQCESIQTTLWHLRGMRMTLTITELARQTFHSWSFQVGPRRWQCRPASAGAHQQAKAAQYNDRCTGVAGRACPAQYDHLEVSAAALAAGESPSVADNGL